MRKKEKKRHKAEIMSKTRKKPRIKQKKQE